MLYLLTLQKELDVEPRYFGKHLRDTIRDKLVHTVSDKRESTPCMHITLLNESSPSAACAC
jgi:hypothetical protein